MTSFVGSEHKPVAFLLNVGSLHVVHMEDAVHV